MNLFFWKRNNDPSDFWKSEIKSDGTTSKVITYKITCDITLNIHNDIHGPMDIVRIYNMYCDNYCGVMQSKNLHCLVLAMGLCRLNKVDGMSKGGDFKCQLKDKITLSFNDNADPGVQRSCQMHRKRLSAEDMLVNISGSTIFEECESDKFYELSCPKTKCGVDFKELIKERPFILRRGKNSTQMCRRP
ncbi:matrix [Sripur virus]|uniref:Matrix n=1 Tax=Sripur virus TaxID=1620897 RepID=A0A0D3R2F0_9RHAB|nr:matrix [Sripur virus]AJR28585.1 matrix [Sripur virus]